MHTIVALSLLGKLVSASPSSDREIRSTLDKGLHCTGVQLNAPAMLFIDSHCLTFD
jgi:hypothetical protein